MDQEEITKIYETLAPMAGNYANAQAEQIGQAQQSVGPLAANTMGTTTSGLGNYTYNRLMRPQVDTMRDQILVQGYANQLNNLLSNALNTAKDNYYKRSPSNSSNDKTSNTPSQTPTNKPTVEDEITDLEPTVWTNLPASYQWKDENGEWHTATRQGWMDDMTWWRLYNGAYKNAKKTGQEFKGGSK